MTRLQAGSWAPIVVGFLAYVCIFMVAFFLEAPALRSVGGLTMVFISSVGNYQRLFTLRVGAPAYWALLAMVPPTLAVLVTPGSPVELVLKYDLMFVVFLQIYSWRLAPMNRTPWRWALLGGCLLLIVVSIVAGARTEWEGTSRLSGVFDNPNNMALMGLALPFFLNDEDPRWQKLLVHAATLGTIFATGTSGAILGYAVGILFRVQGLLTWRRAAVALAVVTIAVVVLLGRKDVAELRLVRQIAAVHASLGELQRHRFVVREALVPMDFGAMVDAHGAGSTSAVWRVGMWIAVLNDYADGAPWQWVIGRGLGASWRLYQILPHNDFVRLLFETGVVGLVAFLAFCWTAWRGMRPGDRYVVPMVLTFCFSENNIDNFVFMGLFMFFLASTQPPVRAPDQPLSWNALVWRALMARGNITAPDGRVPR
jgi:hypothetical protein